MPKSRKKRNTEMFLLQGPTRSISTLPIICSFLITKSPRAALTLHWPICAVDPFSPSQFLMLQSQLPTLGPRVHAPWVSAANTTVVLPILGLLWMDEGNSWLAAFQRWQQSTFFHSGIRIHRCYELPDAGTVSHQSLETQLPYSTSKGQAMNAPW